LEGNLPVNKMKLLQAWIEIHQAWIEIHKEEAKNGEQVFKIEGLK